jgi:NADH-quinone oxidoreductase subunit N
MSYITQFGTFLPGVITALAGLFVILIDSFKEDYPGIIGLTVLSLAAALAISIMELFEPAGVSFSGLLAYGGITAFGNVIILFGSLVSVLISHEYLQAIHHDFGEVYGMILFATTGMLALADANNLLLIFLGIETMSISLYVLAGTVKDRKTGAEAGLKYFLLGAFSTGFLLYGIALLYGATGTLSLPEIADKASTTPLFMIGGGLLFIGFFFKTSSAPFHMWTPDVYEGAPTTVTAYFSTASKAAAFIAFLTIISRMLPEVTTDWTLVLEVIAIITMIVGNTIALVQDNMKRMLAYSSVAHAGYILVGLAAGTSEAYSAVFYYLFAYTIMNVGAFGVVAYYERQHGLDLLDIHNYAGLGFKRPLMGIMLSVFLFSLAGLPGFVGFVGKYYVFAAAIHANLLPLAIIAVIASAVSIYYYLRPMVYMYMNEPVKDISLVNSGWIFKGSLLLLAIMTIYFGLAPGRLTHLLSSYYSSTGWMAHAVLP